MLDVILRLGAQKAVTSVGEVAQVLSISTDLAARLFCELESRGYLKKADACQAPCGACAAKDDCGTSGRPRLWAFTAKGLEAGRRYLEADHIEGQNRP